VAYGQGFINLCDRIGDICCFEDDPANEPTFQIITGLPQSPDDFQGTCFQQGPNTRLAVVDSAAKNDCLVRLIRFGMCNDL